MLYKFKRIAFVFWVMLMLLVLAFCCFSNNYVFSVETDFTKSKACVLIDSDSGEILYEKNKDEKLPIASVTKLMTILIVLEKIEAGELDPQKNIVVSEHAEGMGGSQVFLDANAEYNITELLKAVIIASANDASVALAEEIAGSEQEFCNLMNQKARNLNLSNTNYVNATGLPAPMQYSSAYDVACVMREVVKHPLYFELAKIWMQDFSHPSGRVTTMANTNKLLKTYELCDGGKTGSTNEAGFCLCSTAKQGDMRLICVVLGAENGKQRFSESKTLFEYGFKNFEIQKLVDKNANLGENIKLLKAQENDLQVFAEKDYIVVLKKGEKRDVEAKLLMPSEIFAPLRVGDVIGKIQIIEKGILLDEINVIVNNDVDEQSYFDIFSNILKKWSI